MGMHTAELGVADSEQAVVGQRAQVQRELPGLTTRLPDKVTWIHSHRWRTVTETGGSTVVLWWCGDSGRW
jgi:hypothetical protein